MSFLEEEYNMKYNDDTESDNESEDSEIEMQKPKIKIHNDDVHIETEHEDEYDENVSVLESDMDEDDGDDNSVNGSDADENIFAPSSVNRDTKNSDLATALQFENENENNSDDEEEEEEDDIKYLQKFDENIQKDVIQEYHPEMKMHNYQEVEAMTKIIRDENGIIIDPLHKTIPFITRYEYSRVLGERAKQINAGAKPFINVVDMGLIDGYLIALEEFKQKKIPFIIKRPLPNGGCEYWLLKDLEYIM